MIDEQLPTSFQWLQAIAAFGGISALLAVILNYARHALARRKRQYVNAQGKGRG